MVFRHKYEVNGLRIGLSFFEPEKMFFADSETFQIWVSVVAFTVCKGCDPNVAQAQLCHADPRITLGIYGHVVGGIHRNAVQNRFSKLVNSGPLLESRVLLESRPKTRGKQFGLVGAVGIEPTTFGLKGRCSTTELRP
jgi:hypothetical protein